MDNYTGLRVDVPVKEIMKYNPVTVAAETTVNKAAEKMYKAGTGSCIVLVNGKPTGIVTEEDLTGKIVAQNRKSGDVRVSEIMTTPLITVPIETTVGEATRLMVARKVRRLPVVDGEKVTGLVTIREVLAVSSEMNEIMSELIKFRGEEGSSRAGVCDSCGKMSDSLYPVDGRLLCPACMHHDDNY